MTGTVSNSCGWMEEWSTSEAFQEATQDAADQHRAYVQYGKPLQGYSGNVRDSGQKCTADEEVPQEKQEPDHDALHETFPRSRNDPSRNSANHDGQGNGRRNEPMRADADGANHGDEDSPEKKRAHTDLIPRLVGFGGRHSVEYSPDQRWRECRAIHRNGTLPNSRPRRRPAALRSHKSSKTTTTPGPK